ncbi:MAG: class I SAM-dependent methyltransferase [Candidatus Dormibacteria bacterium]
MSAALLTALATAIQGAPGRTLLDVGGGTGNYAASLAARGWACTVLDVSPSMRRVAAAKGLPVIAGEAASLPFADASFDAVTLISMLHQVGEWRQALREARRVLRPQGCLAVATVSSDHLREVTWAFDLFPSMRAQALPHRPSLEQLREQAPGTTVVPFWFDDLSDASIGALCAFPEAMLDPARRRQTSFFERLEREHPEELEPGLHTLRGWLGSGRSPRAERAAARQRLGDGSVIKWRKPG